MITSFIAVRDSLNSQLRSSILDLGNYIRSSIINGVNLTRRDLNNELYQIYYRKIKSLPKPPLMSYQELTVLEDSLNQLDEFIRNMRLTTIIEEPKYLDSPMTYGITNLVNSFILGPILINNKYSLVIK
jgi:hypothetical protein